MHRQLADLLLLGGLELSELEDDLADGPGEEGGYAAGEIGELGANDTAEGEREDTGTCDVKTRQV